MTAFAGWEYAGALLLVLAGAPKALRPADTQRALRSVGWRVPSVVVRVGGGAEVVIGALAFALGGRVVACLVAASYVAFSAFVLLALGRGGALASCGCLGKPDTPPTSAHVVVTLLLAAGALGAAIGGPKSVTGLAAATFPDAVAFICCTLLVAWLAWVALVDLPRLTTARHEGTA